MVDVVLVGVVVVVVLSSSAATYPIVSSPLIGVEESVVFVSALHGRTKVGEEKLGGIGRVGGTIVQTQQLQQLVSTADTPVDAAYRIYAAATAAAARRSGPG